MSWQPDWHCVETEFIIICILSLTRDKKTLTRDDYLILKTIGNNVRTLPVLSILLCLWVKNASKADVWKPVEFPLPRFLLAMFSIFTRHVCWALMQIFYEVLHKIDRRPLIVQIRVARKWQEKFKNNVKYLYDINSWVMNLFYKFTMENENTNT